MQTKAHHTERQSRYRLELGLKEHLKKKDLSFFFLKCSFRQDVRTNPRGSENDDAQAGKRSCWA